VIKAFTGAAPLIGCTAERNPELFEPNAFVDIIQSQTWCDAKVVVGLSVPREQKCQEIGQGLLSDHIYSLDKFIDVRSKGLPLLLVCTNPWGVGAWKGDWSTKSKTWSKVDPSLHRYKQTRSHQGNFTIAFEDACRHFTDWDFTFIYPEDFFQLRVEGEWTADTAGGRLNRDYKKFFQNTQYLLTIPDYPIAEDGHPHMLFNGQLVVSLHEDEKHKEFQVGFSIFHSDGGDRLTRAWAASKESRTGLNSGFGEGTRDASCLLPELEPGQYIVVPTTFHPNNCAKFTLTLWSSYPAKIKKLLKQGEASALHIDEPDTTL